MIAIPHIKADDVAVYGVAGIKVNAGNNNKTGRLTSGLVIVLCMIQFVPLRFKTLPLAR